MSYSIGELSKKFGIPASTLRYYEKEGLLPVVTRKSSGVREFTSEDCEAVLLVDCLKRGGLSIKEIASVAEVMEKGDRALEQRKKVFDQIEARLTEKIKVLKKCRRQVRYEKWKAKKAQELGSLEDIELLSTSLVPKKIRKIRSEVMKLGQTR